MKKIKIFKTLLYSILICALVVGAVFLGRHLYLNHLSNQPVVFRNVEYKSLKEISPEDIIKHLKTLTFIYENQTIEEFTDDDIAIVVAYSLLMWETENPPTATEKEVKDFVERFFGKSDYDLKPGTYILKGHDIDREIKIFKDGDTYTSNVGGYGLSGLHNKYASQKVVGNQIVVTYNYGYHGDMAPGSNKREIIGKNEIYLESNGKTLFVKKIVYTPVK